MHRIRLRGPWTKTLGDSSEIIRTSVPDRITSTDERSDSSLSVQADKVVCYERRFNQPTGLEVGSVVMLNITTWTGQAIEISLNSKLLSLAGPPFEADITQCLELHNNLRLRLIPSPTALPCLDGEVSLNIFDSATRSIS